VRQGCQGMVQRTFGNPLITAVDLAETADPGCTRTETGLLRAWADYPTAIYVIGNAPTALASPLRSPPGRPASSPSPCPGDWCARRVCGGRSREGGASGNPSAPNSH
jgi:hypothetical protein